MRGRRDRRLDEIEVLYRARFPHFAQVARATRELVQEELFVVLEGTATLVLGEPGEPVELPPGSVTVVPPHTSLQLVNDGPDDAIVLIVGAPPEQGRAEYLSDSWLS